jgi:hypothetical protein
MVQDHFTARQDDGAGHGKIDVTPGQSRRAEGAGAIVIQCGDGSGKDGEGAKAK